MNNFVDGTNPAPVEVGSLRHYLQGFIHPRWLAGFLNHQQLNCTYSENSSEMKRLENLKRFEAQKRKNHIFFQQSSTNKQSIKQTNKRTNEQTNKQTNEQTNKQTNKQTNNQSNKQTNKQTCTWLILGDKEMAQSKQTK